MKLQKGNVLTPVCQSFCLQRVCISACIGADTPQQTPGTPLRKTPPALCMLGYTPPIQCMLRYTHCPLPSVCWEACPPPPLATAVDSTHPTGMHSCYYHYSYIFAIPSLFYFCMFSQFDWLT